MFINQHNKFHSHKCRTDYTYPCVICKEPVCLDCGYKCATARYCIAMYCNFHSNEAKKCTHRNSMLRNKDLEKSIEVVEIEFDVPKLKKIYTDAIKYLNDTRTTEKEISINDVYDKLKTFEEENKIMCGTVNFLEGEIQTILGEYYTTGFISKMYQKGVISLSHF